MLPPHLGEGGVQAVALGSGLHPSISIQVPGTSLPPCPGGLGLSHPNRSTGGLG